MANSTTQSANSNATKLSPHRTPSDNASECPSTPSSTTHQGNLSLSLYSLRSNFLIRHVPPYIADQILLSTLSTCSPSHPNTLKTTFHFLYWKTSSSSNSLLLYGKRPYVFKHISSFLFQAQQAHAITKPELSFSSIFMMHVYTRKICSIRNQFRSKQIFRFTICFVPENVEYPDIRNSFKYSQII
ncbi:hypothetical protein DY000_02048131 [Brassica cretica]|uniref:Uncharacterized protein n=1 Tax=Brassica cretica TaxID=69181 RepID=A0ABQ7ESS3_BRACR|nr:hypothetical protein DY000_02048131 [Brassica cretica]